MTGLATNYYKGLSQNPKVSSYYNETKSFYESMTSLPLFPLMMYFPNRFSERNYRGSELIALAKVR
jgi:hypothetical protein